MQQDYEWNISQEFKFPSVYGTQLKLQKDRISLSEAALTHRKNMLERDVRAAYLKLWFSKSQLILIDELEKEFQNFAIIADKRFESGETNLIEKISAEAKREEISLLKSEASLDIENLRKQLQLLLNIENSIAISSNELQKIPFMI